MRRWRDDSIGDRRLRWDGSGEDGARVSPGLYLLRVEAAGRSATLKVIALGH